MGTTRQGHHDKIFGQRVQDMCLIILLAKTDKSRWKKGAIVQCITLIETKIRYGVVF